MARILLLAGATAGVLLIATGGHLSGGLFLIVGLTLLLGLIEPLTAK